MKLRLSPGLRVRRKFEYRSAAPQAGQRIIWGAAEHRRPIEIAGGVQGQAPPRSCPIGSPFEGVEYLLSPAAGTRRQFENCTLDCALSPLCGGAVQVA